MCKGWWGEDKTCFQALIKVQAVFLCWHLISAVWGYACCCWGMWEAFQACALHMRGSYSTGQVSVQAQGSLPSVKTNRAVIFSSSAYRNWKFPSCPLLLAENRQLRDRPERPGRTSGPHTPGIGESCAAQAIFNLFLLHTGSRASHCFLPSLCLCVFAAPSCCHEMCELYMAWEICTRQYF